MGAGPFRSCASSSLLCLLVAIDEYPSDHRNGSEIGRIRLVIPEQEHEQGQVSTTQPCRASLNNSRILLKK